MAAALEGMLRPVIVAEAEVGRTEDVVTARLSSREINVLEGTISPFSASITML